MSKREVLQRHRLIISKLRRGPCSFEQLQDFLELESEISGENFSCSLRTFQRDIEEIESLYNIVIKYVRSSRAYQIVEDGNETQKERLLEAFEIFNALNMANNLSEQVILEQRKPLGTDNLHDLLRAIRKRRQVSFSYERYLEGDKTERKVNPIAIKESRNRWYLLGQEEGKKKVKSFGLDRITGLQVTGAGFPPVDYDADKAYQYSFGMYNGPDQRPERIVLSFTPPSGKYIKSLPLHQSQEILVENEEEIRFAYYLLPTPDFLMEVLSHGGKVKVLEPKSFRNKVQDTLKAALAQYQAS